jgi:hypothetical protein
VIQKPDIPVGMVDLITGMLGNDDHMGHQIAEYPGLKLLSGLTSILALKSFSFLSHLSKSEVDVHK